MHRRYCECYRKGGFKLENLPREPSTSWKTLPIYPPTPDGLTTHRLVKDLRGRLGAPNLRCGFLSVVFLKSAI